MASRKSEYPKLLTSKGYFTEGLLLRSLTCFITLDGQWMGFEPLKKILTNCSNKHKLTFENKCVS